MLHPIMGVGGNRGGGALRLEMRLWKRSGTIFPKCEIEILNGGSIPITIKMAGIIVMIGKIKLR